MSHTAPTAGSCCGGGALQIGQVPPATDAAVAAVADDETAVCPVMTGSRVVKAHAEEAGLVREHDGRTFWLCCDSCGPLFDADPARYAAAV